jgi:hypothetical protein
MLVTEVGIDTATTELHSRRANSPTLVTDIGMIRYPHGHQRAASTESMSADAGD